MLRNLRAKINGNMPQVIQAIIITGILFWMFCQVRDLPATYVTKAEYQTGQQEIAKSIGGMDKKIDDIHYYLMGRKK